MRIRGNPSLFVELAHNEDAIIVYKLIILSEWRENSNSKVFIRCITIAA